ncbi:hypothetical protein NA56DRAFT_666692 [Hyaloscypha hepaticicola]|uniref:Uncharacterized protein n=1 Tax=Hyaloscypha hepaticicola TaxID=2082293 RepID=A0A2J6PDI2_9HELO|nr:hypothetical protein NA56DRAFT_666692 [Hyaloscypha hepaticicola]
MALPPTSKAPAARSTVVVSKDLFCSTIWVLERILIVKFVLGDKNGLPFPFPDALPCPSAFKGKEISAPDLVAMVEREPAQNPSACFNWEFKAKNTFFGLLGWFNFADGKELLCRNTVVKGQKGRKASHQLPRGTPDPIFDSPKTAYSFKRQYYYWNYL